MPSRHVLTTKRLLVGRRDDGLIAPRGTPARLVDIQPIAGVLHAQIEVEGYRCITRTVNVEWPDGSTLTRGDDVARN